MTKLSLALLILAHLTGPGLVYAPVQDSYRVEVQAKRIAELLDYKLICIKRGIHRDADGKGWR